MNDQVGAYVGDHYLPLRVQRRYEIGGGVMELTDHSPDLCHCPALADQVAVVRVYWKIGLLRVAAAQLQRRIICM
jgi:hypothetical protein